MLGADAELLLSLVGMSACFGAVVRAPLTALLIVFEMTHRYEIVPALMIGTVVSQAVARLWGGSHNFYDATLEQDGIVLD
jgi:CIC family chloride channel protein